MAVSKTISDLASHGYHTYWMTVTETGTSTTANTSTVRVEFGIKPYKTGYDWEDYTGSEQPKGTFTVDGTSYSWSLSAYADKASQVIKTITKTVAHSADGTKSLKFSFSATSGSTYYLPGSASASGTLKLTDIPRNPVLKCAVYSKEETTVTIDWTADAKCKNLQYQLNSGDWVSFSQTGKGGTYKITGLREYTAYSIKVRGTRTDNNLVGTSSAVSTKTYRYPYIATPPQITIGKTAKATVYNPLGRQCTVTMEVPISGQTTVIDTKTTNGTSITFTTVGHETELYGTIPNDSYGTYTARVVSTATKTSEGRYVVDSATSAPSFDMHAVIEDMNSAVVSVTGDSSIIVQGKSNVRVIFYGFEAKNGASIDETHGSCFINIAGTTRTMPYELPIMDMSVDGQTRTVAIDTLGTIDWGSDLEYSVTITDSRGLSTTVSGTLEIQQYKTPTMTASAVRHNNYYSETDVGYTVDYTRVGNNEITAYYKAQEYPDGAWVVSETQMQDNPEIVTLDNKKRFNVTVRLVDSFGAEASDTVFLDKGMPIVYFDRILRSMGINCFPTKEEQFTVNDVDILDWIMPKKITPTVSSVSGVTVGSLQVWQSSGICMITFEFTLTAALSSWTTVATGLPIPATAVDSIAWYDTAEGWGTSFARNARVQISTAGNLNIRYGAATSYRISIAYPIHIV